MVSNDFKPRFSTSLKTQTTLKSSVISKTKLKPSIISKTTLKPSVISTTTPEPSVTPSISPPIILSAKDLENALVFGGKDVKTTLFSSVKDLKTTLVSGIKNLLKKDTLKTSVKDSKTPLKTSVKDKKDQKDSKFTLRTSVINKKEIKDKKDTLKTSVKDSKVNKRVYPENTSVVDEITLDSARPNGDSVVLDLSSAARDGMISSAAPTSITRTKRALSKTKSDKNECGPVVTPIKIDKSAAAALRFHDSWRDKRMEYFQVTQLERQKEKILKANVKNSAEIVEKLDLRIEKMKKNLPKLPSAAEIKNNSKLMAYESCDLTHVAIGPIVEKLNLGGNVTLKTSVEDFLNTTKLTRAENLCKIFEQSDADFKARQVFVKNLEENSIPTATFLKMGFNKENQTTLKTSGEDVELKNGVEVQDLENCGSSLERRVKRFRVKY